MIKVNNGVPARGLFAAMVAGMVLLAGPGLQQVQAQHVDLPPGSYMRLYVENRCYRTVDVVLEDEKGDRVLPAVDPRSAGIVLFGWPGSFRAERVIRFSRPEAMEKRMTMEEISAASKKERWMMGNHVVDSWYLPLCLKEGSLDNPGSATWRRALPDEQVDEYEMFFSRVPGSTDPMHVYGHFPVRVLVNDVPVRTLRTSRQGVLRILFSAATTGVVTFDGASAFVWTVTLGENMKPVRTRTAGEDEEVLVVPEVASGWEDW